MKKVLTVGGGILGALVVGVAGLAGWLLSAEYMPEAVEAAEVRCATPGTPLQAGEPFEVLSWNLQYGASRKHRFFYDGGEAVHVPAEDRAWAVTQTAQVIASVGAPLVLLQEIDRDSDRTQRVDQLPAYEEAAGASCATSASYHRHPFVPAPGPSVFLGRVDMALGLLSRAPMARAQRHQLPLLDEPAYRQAFNLKRALITAEVEVAGWDQPLAVGTTHLSAFSFGDGTLQKQVAMLQAWMEARPAGQPWILSGDFNLLPTGDDKARLSTERDLYADSDSPIDPLLAQFAEAMGDQLDPANRTYLPYGHDEPDRKIDYIFYGGPLYVTQASVMREASAISDHLPMRATFVVGEEPVDGEPAGDDTADPTQ